MMTEKCKAFLDDLENFDDYIINPEKIKKFADAGCGKAKKNIIVYNTVEKFSRDALAVRDVRAAQWIINSAWNLWSWNLLAQTLNLCSCDSVDCALCAYSKNSIAFLNAVKCGAFLYFETNDEICILVRPIIKSQNRQFHSVTTAALKWDDLSIYYLHGVKFEYELWERIVKKTIPSREILQLANQEQKSAAMRVYGYENILKDLQAKTLAKKSLSINGKIEEYQTLEVDLKDDTVPARFVKVICWSTGKTHLLRVDPRMDSTRDPIGALAWTANVKPGEYILEKIMET